MENDRFYDLLESEKLIAIVREKSAEEAEKYARSLLEGKIRLLEISVTTPGAFSVMRTMQASFPDALIGVGTIIDTDSAKRAAEAGARFVIAPNMDEEVIRYLCAKKIPVLPGVASVTEIVRAVRAGARAVKLFPAGVYGTEFIRAVRAPLPDCKIVAVGGVSEQNAAEWLKAGAIAVGMGAKLVGKGENVREAAARVSEMLRKI